MSLRRRQFGFPQAFLGMIQSMFNFPNWLCKKIYFLVFVLQTIFVLNFAQNKEQMLFLTFFLRKRFLQREKHLCGEGQRCVLDATGPSAKWARWKHLCWTLSAPSVHLDHCPVTYRLPLLCDTFPQSRKSHSVLSSSVPNCSSLSMSASFTNPSNAHWAHPFSSSSSSLFFCLEPCGSRLMTSKKMFSLP